MRPTGDADAVNITKTVFAFPDAVESEDCLYLNVFVPSTKTKGRAVMNWLFPGNLFFGDASRPLYDGSQLAAKYDVIVVAGNYRTNGKHSSRETGQASIEGRGH